MSFNYVALNQDRHSQLRINPVVDFNHIADQYLLPVSLSEFERASGNFPIVFVKNSMDGEFESVIVTGLEHGENLWYEQNSWQSNFVPQSITRAPLGLTASPEDGEKLIVVIDENSQSISQTQGERLFNDNGEQSSYLKTRIDALVKYHEDSMYGKLLLQLLQEYGLLVEIKITLKVDGQAVDVSGIYVIDRQRLQNMSAQNISSLHLKGYLLPIHAQLISMHHFERLAQKKTQKLRGNKIKN